MKNNIYDLIGLDNTAEYRLKLIILISCFLLAGIFFFISLANVSEYGGVDLRNRIVGARLYMEGINPYIVPAKPPKNEYFLNPAQRYPGRSAVTVTPAVLIFYNIFAWIPYSPQRFIWAIMDWLAMITSLFLLLKSVSSLKMRYYLTCFCLVFICCQYFWLLHIERGQYYIYLTLLLSLSIYLENKYKQFIYSGISLGLLIILRPTFIVLIILYIFAKKIKTALVMCATTIIIFSFTLISGGFQTWISYYDNVKAVQNEVISDSYLSNTYGPSNNVLEMAEGRNIIKMIPSESINTTFLGISSIIGKQLHKNVPAYYVTINKAMLLLLIVAIVLMAWVFSEILKNNKILLLYCINSVLLIEVFAPERYSYQDVIFMPVIALILPILISSIEFKWEFILMIIAFSIQFIFPTGAASFMRFLLFLITLNSILYLYLSNKWRERGEIIKT